MEKLISLYLNYVNNFLTVDKFADHERLSVEDAYTVIDLGRKYNDIKARNRQ